MSWTDYSTNNSTHMVFESGESRFTAEIQSATTIGAYFLIIRDGQHILRIFEHDDIDKAMDRGAKILGQLEYNPFAPVL